MPALSDLPRIPHGFRAELAALVALNLASLTFMVPLGVSAAAAVLVGHAVGARADRPRYLAAGSNFNNVSRLHRRDRGERRDRRGMAGDKQPQ